MSLSTQLVALNSKTNGKDKIFRSVQYGCKMIWYILWTKKGNKDYIEILKKIEAAMSSTRKTLRLGKTHDMLENALKSIHLQDEFLRIVLTFVHINQGCYLLLDNLLWLNGMGVVKWSAERTKEVSRWSNKFWLFSSILFVARDLHDWVEVIQTQEEEVNRNKSTITNKYTLNQSSGAYTSARSSTPSRSAPSRSVLVVVYRVLRRLRSILMNKKYRPLLLDTAKNVFDIFLPMANLDFIKISPGLQGLYGLISSLIGLLIVFDSKYKLTP